MNKKPLEVCILIAKKHDLRVLFKNDATFPIMLKREGGTEHAEMKLMEPPLACPVSKSANPADGYIDGFRLVGFIVLGGKYYDVVTELVPGTYSYALLTPALKSMAANTKATSLST